MEVKLSNKTREITKEKILQTLNGIIPLRIYKYYVIIYDKKFPIKQIIAETLKISPMAFTSQQAYKILQALGFDIKEQR